MAGVRQEIVSPMLYDWEFQDELGIVLDIGRFVVPSSDEQNIVARMGIYQINDGRTVVGRTQTFREVDGRPISFSKMPYNLVMELKNRVGARFRIRDHLGDYMWVALKDMNARPLQGMVWVRAEQMYDVTLNFIQVNPI